MKSNSLQMQIPAFDIVTRCHTIDDAIKLIKQIDALKVALEAAETFRSQALMYARLEAEALLRVVDLGGLSSLKAPHKKTAEWLSALSLEERERYIELCAEGLTIDQVYKREVGCELKKTKQLEHIRSEREYLVSELRSEGIVDVSSFAEETRRVFCDDPITAKSIIDGAREMIRKAGGVGVGDGAGIYVSASSNRKDEIKEALVSRFESARRDLHNICEIASAANVKLTSRDFIRGEKWAFENDKILPHIFLALSRMGVIDTDSLCDEIARADWRRECEAVMSGLRISREKYVLAQAEKIMSERATA